MDVSAFCRRSKVVFVVGKGGVGKTTVAATFALTAARVGCSVLVVSLDESGGLSRLVSATGPIGYEPVAGMVPPSLPGHVAGELTTRMITSNAALTEYLGEHGLGRVLHQLVRSGALDVVATAIPGIREVLILGKVKQLEVARTADVIVVDAPASGHAIGLMSSAMGVIDSARAGPLRKQAEDVAAMLADPKRASVLLVSTLEETPVNETIETAYALEEDLGVALGPIVANGVIPALQGIEDLDPEKAASQAGVALSDELARALGAAAEFRAARQCLQRQELERLKAQLPLPILELPMLFSVELGPDEAVGLSEAFANEIASL